MNFRKISERGGGVISDPKNFVAFFFALKTPNLVMIFWKNVKKGGGHFRSEKFRCKFGAVWSGLEKNRNIFFRKRGGGGRSRAVRKFSGNSSLLGNIGFPYAKPLPDLFLQARSRRGGLAGRAVTLPSILQRREEEMMNLDKEEEDGDSDSSIDADMGL